MWGLRAEKILHSVPTVFVLMPHKLTSKSQMHVCQGERSDKRLAGKSKLVTIQALLQVLCSYTSPVPRTASS